MIRLLRKSTSPSPKTERALAAYDEAVTAIDAFELAMKDAPEDVSLEEMPQFEPMVEKMREFRLRATEAISEL